MEDKIYINEPQLVDNEQKKFPVSAGVIWGLQILSIVFISWIITSFGNSGTPFFDVLGVIYFAILGMILFLILGIIGIVFSIKLKKKNYKNYSTFLLASSILMATVITPNYLAGIIGNIFSPYIKEKQIEVTEKAIEKSVAQFEAAPKVHYDILSKLFEQPQKIINSKYTYLLLENGQMLEPFGFYTVGSAIDGEISFEKYAKEFLVGNYIKIGLPDYSDFLDTYFPNARTIFIDGNWPKDPEFNIHYGIVPALIYKDGELVNLKFTAGSRLEKYK